MVFLFYDVVELIVLFIIHIGFWKIINFGQSCSDIFVRDLKHPAGRAFISDWSANGFVIVVYEKFFYSCIGQKILTKLKKKSHRQP